MRSISGWCRLFVLGLTLSRASANGAERQLDKGERAQETPKLSARQAHDKLLLRPVRRVDWVTLGGRWHSEVPLPWLKPGVVLTAELGDRVIEAVTASGNFASATLEAEADGDGVVLRIVVEPRRIVSDVRVTNGLLSVDETLTRAGLVPGGVIVAGDLAGISERIRGLYRERGFPHSEVTVQAVDTDDPMAVVVLVGVRAGSPAPIIARRFRIQPRASASLVQPFLTTYDAGRGDRADRQALERSDQELERELKQRGWFDASVSHRTIRAPRLGGSVVEVFVRAGPKYVLRIQGNTTFDTTELEAALRSEGIEALSLPTLEERLRTFYRQRGFLDVDVRATEHQGPGGVLHDLVFMIRERKPVAVVGREYICLTGERTPADVGAEIDSFLSEELPGVGILGPVDPNVIDPTLGGETPAGKRPEPFELNPWKTYMPEVYERATKHLRDLYRSEGYLAAEVGPVQLLRRRCAPNSPPGRCLPEGSRKRPAIRCAYDETGLPLDEPPPDPALACVPNPRQGISCEPSVMLHIPVKLGPRTFLYDVEFAGNEAVAEQTLLEATEIELGAPLEQAALERARRRIVDTYREEGFAFAEVETDLEFSGDRTRGKVRFLINESERVKVQRIVVRGAEATSESLIRRRVALEVGQPYRQSLVRTTEERLAALGVFASVSVGFEDPYVPAREKVVVVTLQERRPQYLDVRPGFSTGEGFRITFEYGHRNLMGQAIQLTLRSQLGYLPTPLILEGDVRDKYAILDVGERLERRNSITAEFPEVLLGPPFRLNVEGVDVRDNARDFGLTKDAGIVTLIYRPLREFTAQIGGSLERNDTEIFGKEALESYIERHPELAQSFRAPDGTTAVVAQRLALAWDRRDQPLDARRGTLLSLEVEHVHATPLEDDGTEARGSESVFVATQADFLRTTGRAAAYLPLSADALVLAFSLRAGVITQLIDGSRTYPDRLFFLGGVDSLRGFPQDSLVPEDRARELLAAGDSIRPEQIPVRGGDAFVNPRAELRIPLSAAIQTALFFDSGNIWTKATFAPFRLRSSVGTGLRVATPVGPLVFDYGFNLDRVLDQTTLSKRRARTWEDLGAFHFSVGLF